MPSQSVLDKLVRDAAHATFHDGVVRAVHADFAARVLFLDVDICVGDPDADEAGRQRRRQGQIQIEGLKVWALDPPGPGGNIGHHGLWLTADGPLSECPTETARALSAATESAIQWFLFFSDLNAFAYIVGERASFKWG